MRVRYIGAELRHLGLQGPIEDQAAIRPDDRAGVALHHSGHPKSTPITIATEHVQRRGWATAGYTFIWRAGIWHQTAPLEWMTWHALGVQSRLRYALCWAGDYGVMRPGEDGLLTGAELVAHLFVWHGWTDPYELVGPPGYQAARCAGHREMPRSSQRERKTCPGLEFPTVHFRDLVLEQLLGPLKGMTTLDAERAMRDGGMNI